MCLGFLAKKIITFLFYTASVFLLISCNSGGLDFFKIIPLQLSRVVQKESYEQIFVISNATECVGSSAVQDELDKRLDEVFTSMIGAKNWQYLKNHYGVEDVRCDLIKGRIKMHGMIGFIAYLDVFDKSQGVHFVLEGSGRYFAIRESTNAILMSGDIKIVPRRYSINDLNNECIALEINLYTTRIPGETTYYHQAKMYYALKMKKIKEGVFGINYSEKQKGYLKLDKSKEKLSHVADLKLSNGFSYVKLFDLSNSGLIKADYGQVITSSNSLSSEQEFISQTLCPVSQGEKHGSH